MKSLILDGNSLKIPDCTGFLRHSPPVSIDDKAVERMNESRRIVEKAITSNETYYGINTGFGKLADVRIDNDQLADLQVNLVRSHAAGVGEPFPNTIVKLMMMLKVNALVKGYSGCRPVVAETIASMLNTGVYPVIPSKGSVGASGDLAPLAHLALAVIGEGEVTWRGKRVPSLFALKQEDIPPVALQAKEGLAILNGTQASLAAGIDAFIRLENLVKAADILGATSVEALKGTDTPFREELHAIRDHNGQQKSARNLYTLLQESEIHESHRDCGKVQDMYSLRCMPQVHGASRDNMEYARKILTTEMNSCTDNPVVFPETGKIISGGNFHAEPVGMVLDSLGTAAAELGSISERRIAAMMDPTMSQMPAFLTRNSGLQSGYMIPQVTAAALASENKGLAHPSTVDSIPTSANQEDHVSMATFAARKLREIVGNVEQILAVEWLCAVQGLDLKDGLKPAKLLQPVYDTLREKVPTWGEDRVHSKDMNQAVTLLRDGKLVEAVEANCPLE
ncbi:MAG: Histidine ammonia-lyase [Candidatus Marinimicrobia bacterium]|nr:Histidine ammonia-lyase [Candidatus Neomarinimicrobiota bacterium]